LGDPNERLTGKERIIGNSLVVKEQVYARNRKRATEIVPALK